MKALFQKRLDSRSITISNLSSLDSSKRAESNYDSLVHVQEIQTKAVKVFQAQVDSLKLVLSTIK
jgi:hypothetical protein